MGVFDSILAQVYKSVKFVDTVYSQMNQAEIQIAQSRCHVVAFDILNNSERWFTGQELRDGIRCSSALWLATPPISYQNSLYSDGGVTEVFPLDYITQHDANTSFNGQYFFIDCDARVPYKNPVPTDGLTMMSQLQWAAASRLADIELAQFQERMLNLTIVRPSQNILLSALDINPERMQQTFQAGYTKGLTLI